MKEDAGIWFVRFYAPVHPIFYDLILLVVWTLQGNETFLGRECNSLERKSQFWRCMSSRCPLIVG